jgi:hypothetical protein
MTDITKMSKYREWRREYIKEKIKSCEQVESCNFVVDPGKSKI